MCKIGHIDNERLIVMSLISQNGNLYGLNAALNTQKSQQKNAVQKNPEVERRDCMSFSLGGVDSEEQEIMNRLLAYGCSPTGDKATDKAMLHRIELERAKQDNYVSNKYLTVSASECEKIQERKKENRKIGNPEKSPQKQDERLGDKLRGEQIYLAIKMKKKDN